MRRVLVIGISLVLVACLYVLSYAPLCHWGGTHFRVVVNAHEAPNRPPSCYKPVYWLVDFTPLREPFLKWAGVWGVRDRMVRDSEIRKTMRFLARAHERARELEAKLIRQDAHAAARRNK